MICDPRALLCLTVLLAGCCLTSPAQAEEELGTPVGTLTVPEGLSDDEVTEVIAYSLAARSWTLKSKKDNRVIGHITHRGREAIITFVLKDGMIKIYCEGYRISKSGERLKPSLPDGWIANLKKDIPKRLGMKAATK